MDEEISFVYAMLPCIKKEGGEKEINDCMKNANLITSFSKKKQTALKTPKLIADFLCV